MDDCSSRRRPAKGLELGTPVVADRISLMEVHPFATCDFDPETYGAAIVPFVGAFVVGRNGITDEEARAWIAEQRELGERGEFYFASTQFLLHGDEAALARRRRGAASAHTRARRRLSPSLGLAVPPTSPREPASGLVSGVALGTGNRARPDRLRWWPRNSYLAVASLGPQARSHGCIAPTPRHPLLARDEARA